MKKNFIEIEIPFGAKDSELYQFTYKIPDGYSAEIKDGKVIVKKKESEDERIRKKCIELISRVIPNGDSHSEESKDIVDCLAYLEKQKGQKRSLNFDAISSWLIDHASKYVNGEFNEFHHCVEYDGTIDVERLIADLKVAVDDGTFDEQKEQKPNIELIQRSWYMEGYHDREFGREPKWIIKTGEGGPKYEKNEKYGQLLEQKPAEWSEEDKKHFAGCIAFFYGISEESPYYKDYKWLKSIGRRLCWKPSREQMESLYNAVVRCKACSNTVHLPELYEDLKTL